MQVKQLFKTSLIAASLMAVAACTTPQDTPSYGSTIISIPNYGNFTRAEIEQYRNIRTIYFDTNSAEIKPQYQRALAVQAWILTQDWRLNNQIKQTQKTQSITIDGHADVRGSEKYNRSLAQVRAIAIANFFKSQGVNTKYLNVVTFGKERPINVNNDKLKSEAASRRVMIKYNNYAVDDFNYSHYNDVNVIKYDKTF